MKKPSFRRYGWILASGLAWPSLAQAEEISRDTSFENAPWISARAAGLGEALSTTATGLDALYYNPALIGGVHDKIEKPFITHLFMPYIGTSTTDGANGILVERLQGSALGSDAVFSDLRSAWDSDPVYARATFTPAIVFNRLMLGYTHSTRTSAYRDDEDPANPLLRVSEKTSSGPLLGFSATAPKEEFYLGVSAAFITSSETDAAFSAVELDQSELRSTRFKEGKETYGAMPIHIGSAYRFRHKIKPSLSLVVQDIGSTRYSPSDKTQETRIQKENTTLGFSVSPEIGTIGTLHVTTEVTRLTDSAVDFGDKLRASTEFTLGERFAADAGLGIRIGYTSAGLSYGAGLNLGILHAQIASFAEDVGIEKSKVVERKSVLNVGINIADF